MSDMNGWNETMAQQCFDACRAQFDAGLAVASALAAGAERMRGVQLAAAQALQAKHAEIAERSARAGTLQDLFALQSALATDYASGALDYWTRLAVIARETQAQVAALAQAQGRSALERAASGAQKDAPAAATAAAPEPLVKVMQAAFDAARDANEAFVKALGVTPMLPPAAPKAPAKKPAARPS